MKEAREGKWSARETLGHLTRDYAGRLKNYPRQRPGGGD
jgi:hypothetical protein